MAQAPADGMATSNSVFNRQKIQGISHALVHPALHQINQVSLCKEVVVVVVGGVSLSTQVPPLPSAGLMGFPLLKHQIFFSFFGAFSLSLSSISLWLWLHPMLLHFPSYPRCYIEL